MQLSFIFFNLKLLLLLLLLNALRVSRKQKHDVTKQQELNFVKYMTIGLGRSRF